MPKPVCGVPSWARTRGPKQNSLCTTSTFDTTGNLSPHPVQRNNRFRSRLEVHQKRMCSTWKMTLQGQRARGERSRTTQRKSSGERQLDPRDGGSRGGLDWHRTSWLEGRFIAAYGKVTKCPTKRGIMPRQTPRPSSPDRAQFRVDTPGFLRSNTSDFCFTANTYLGASRDAYCNSRPRAEVTAAWARGFASACKVYTKTERIQVHQKKVKIW